MQSKYDILRQVDQEAVSASQELARLLEIFLSPLLLALDKVLDKRKVANTGAVLRCYHPFQESQARVMAQ